jgi:ApaG protein
MAQYSATTSGVVVSVQTVYLAEQSDPEADMWVWAYQVRIENQRAETVQLISRTWRITDARGHTQIVEGPGVVGKQPKLAPGEAFEYTSGTPLGTASGFMSGLYHMVVPASGETFDAEIPTFSLDTPTQARSVH